MIGQWEKIRRATERAFAKEITAEDAAQTTRALAFLRYADPESLVFIQHDLAINEDIEQRPWAYNHHYLLLQD